MATAIENTEHSVFDEMRELFCDLPWFEEKVARELRLAIADIESKVIQINFATVKKFAHRYFATGRFVTKDEIELWKEIQWIFTSCCVLIMSRRPEVRDHCFKKTEELINAYPTFFGLRETELNLLLKFRNAVVATLTVVSARHNKQLILYIAGRLEGTQKRYVTGSGMSEAVKRRVSIYEQEGKVEAEPRPERSNSLFRGLLQKHAHPYNSNNQTGSNSSSDSYPSFIKEGTFSKDYFHGSSGLNNTGGLQQPLNTPLPPLPYASVGSNVNNPSLKRSNSGDGLDESAAKFLRNGMGLPMGLPMGSNQQYSSSLSDPTHLTSGTKMFNGKNLNFQYHSHNHSSTAGMNAVLESLKQQPIMPVKQESSYPGLDQLVVLPIDPGAGMNTSVSLPVSAPLKEEQRAEAGAGAGPVKKEPSALDFLAQVASSMRS